jgi:hypothetical protein
MGRMLDENHFLSPYGIRSLSRWHLDHPYTVQVHGEEYRVQATIPSLVVLALASIKITWRGQFSYIQLDSDRSRKTGNGNL